MNAFKHGMRARKQALLHGDSIAFENRLHEWMAIAEPADDMAEFLLHQNVFMSFEVERARRAHLERLTSQIESSEDTEIEEVWELGNRLFFDPSGPCELYGAPGVFRSKVRTSWTGRPDDPNDPAALVRKLESSEPGCWYLRACWEDLRAQLVEPGKFWQSHDRLRAIRLLGRQPLSAIRDRRVAEIFVASHALNPVGETPFDYLVSDMTEMDLDRYRKGVQAQWPDLVSTKDTAQCRQLLIDLADCAIEQLDSSLAEYAADADANAQKSVNRLSAHKSPEGRHLGAYHTKCLNAYHRGVETLRKYQGKKKAQGRDKNDEYAGMMEKDEGRRTSEEERRAEDGGWRIPDFARWVAGADASDHVPDRSFVGGNGERDSFEPSMDWDALPDWDPQADCGTGMAGATESASATMTADATDSDGATLSDGTRASASPTLSVGITRLEASEPGRPAGRSSPNKTGIEQAAHTNPSRQRGAAALAAAEECPADPLAGASGWYGHDPIAGNLIPADPLDAGAADAGRSSPDVSGADVVPNGGDEMSPRGENSENSTNEAKSDESVIIIQNKDPVDVAANSGVDAGLDRGQETLGVGPGKRGLDRGSSRVVAAGGCDRSATPSAVAVRGPGQPAGNERPGSESTKTIEADPPW